MRLLNNFINILRLVVFYKLTIIQFNYFNYFIKLNNY